MKQRYFRSRGAALLIVLATLVLACILVVGLTVAMRMERSASFYNLERTRADFIARQGVDSGAALLLEIATANRYWVSGPGIVTASPPDTMSAPNTVISLSSGYSTNTNSDTSVDLNRPALDVGDRVLDPSGGNMNYKWIYVQKDGTYATNKGTNAVGRFAFWVDDLSTRVDLNTADTRTTSMPGDPSQITLGALPGLAPYSSLIAASALAAPLTTPLEVLGRDTTWTNALFGNRFLLTHYTQDPDVNPWGESRIVLTTQASRAVNRKYLQILNAPGADPGISANLDPVTLQSAYTNVTSYLGRTNWPYAAGNSFVTKFGANGISQLALDTIEYVRTAESGTVWPDPIVANASTNTLTLLPDTTQLDGLTGAVFIGTVRRPMLSQVGIYCSTNINGGGNGFLGTLHVQTWLPASYNAGGTSYSGWTLWAQIASSSGATTNTFSAPIGAVTYSGEYATNAVSIEIPATVAAGIPTNAMVRVALLKGSSPVITNILDVAPLKEASFINCPIATNITAYSAVNDPRVNKSPSNWSASTNLIGDSGPGTHSVNYSAYAPVPASDGSTNGVYLRPTNSAVTSIGELGFLPTGINSQVAAPWRSLRLQANSSSNVTTPPDWAMMDLFSVPIAPRFVPGTNLISGRINLNAMLRDSGNLTRTNVLNALFKNASGVTALTVGPIVDSVIRVQLAPSGLNFGQATNITNFVSVGQLCEILNVGDKGEAGEGMIRDVASLATVRGDVFAVYSCGQAISVNGSKVVVNGEKMVGAIVERYFDQDDSIKFRTISWSEIYP